MRKIYLIVGSFMVFAMVACNDADTAASEDVSDTDIAEEQVAATPIEPSKDAIRDSTIAHAFTNDKSEIKANDIDVNDMTYTSRTKILYYSDENGKSLAVVYGFKNTNDGIALMQLEGEKPISLKQSSPLTVESVSFSGQGIVLTRKGSVVELNENGDVVNYAAIQ